LTAAIEPSACIPVYPIVGGKESNVFRILLGTVLGAIVFFVWGALAWTVLQLHTLHTIEDEQRVVQVLSEAITEPGVYWFPNLPRDHMTASPEQQEANWDAVNERHRAGPIGLLNFHPDGMEQMPPATFIKGLSLNLVMAMLASLLLAAASVRPYLGRVAFVAAIGLIVGVSAHMIKWNYLHFPLDYSVMQVVDNVIGWSLAGLVIAAVVRPTKKD
jgi:hypothetical protein